MSQTRILIPLPLILVDIVMSFFQMEDETFYYGCGVIGLWENCMKVPGERMALLLNGVCKGGHYKLARYLMDEKKIRVNADVVFDACLGRNFKLIDCVMGRIDKSAEVFISLSNELCTHNMIKEMTYLITEHKVPIACCLVGACKADNIPMAKLLAFLYSIDYDEYLSISCRFNSLKCVKFMIKSGATFCNHCYTPANDHHTK